MLGGILHPKASLKDASDLKQFLTQIQLTIHIVPHDDRDIQAATLLDCPCHVDVLVNDVWCGYERVEYAPRMYKSSCADEFVYTRDQAPALMPLSAKEYRYSRFLLVTHPGGVERIPFTAGPRVHEWRDQIPNDVQGGDLVRVWYPQPSQMILLRAYKKQGARLRVVSTRTKTPTTFWSVFHSVMDGSPGRIYLQKLLSRLIHDMPKISFSTLHVHAFGDFRDVMFDCSGDGIVRVSGTNGVGKSALFVHMWCWVLLGIWRGQRSPQTVGEGTHVTLRGIIGSRVFSMDRRVSSHEHVLRLTINGQDHTQDTPRDTSFYFHQHLLHWDLSLTCLFNRWMRLLVLQPTSAPIACPYVDILRAAESTIKNVTQRMRADVATNQALLKHSRRTMKILRKNLATSEHCVVLWEDWRRELLRCLERDNKSPCPKVPILPSDGKEEQERVDTYIDRLQQLRNEYFKVIRERRVLDVEAVVRHSGKDTDDLRKAMLYAEQEQEARKRQDCSISTRVDMHMKVEMAKQAYQRAMERDVVRRSEARKTSAEHALHILSQEIAVVSKDLTVATAVLDAWKNEQKRVEDIQYAVDRRRALEERIHMLREDRCPAEMRAARLRRIIEKHEPQMNRLSMYCEELSQRVLVMDEAQKIADVRSRWVNTWFRQLDERATFLWHHAGWDDSVSFHGGEMHREAVVQYPSLGQDQRSTIVYFMAFLECIPQMPCFVLKDVDVFLDPQGKAGLLKLVLRWCNQNPRRTCWRFTRDTDGDINIDGL